MTYTLTSATVANNTQIVIRDADGASIPPDPLNADFQVYLSVARGRQYTDAVHRATGAGADVPALAIAGDDDPAQWTAAQTAVAALDNPAVSAFFAHGTNVIPANSTTLVSLGTAIGLTSDQVTVLVQEASAISIP